MILFCDCHTLSSSVPVDPYCCLTAVGKVFSFHQLEQKGEMCYILASLSTALKVTSTVLDA